MPLETLTCPHCRSTLKPARPVPEGKTVKCPRCGDTFTAGEDRARPAPGPRKGTAPPPRATPAPAAQPAEEEANTYAVVRDPDLDEADQARRKKKARRDEEDEGEDDEGDEGDEEEDDVLQMYLRQTKSKDPRGPAQEKIVGPSNWLLRSALAGFFGWAITLMIFFIPVAFPNLEKKKDEEKAAKQMSEKDREKEEQERRQRAGFTLERILDDPLHIGLFVGVLLLGVVHACLIGVGAVKMQHLESWRWSVVGCVLTILPLHLLPAYWLFWTVCDFIMDEGGMYFAAVIFLAGPAVGIPCLMTVQRRDVKAGFEYKAD